MRLDAAQSAGDDALIVAEQRAGEQDDRQHNDQPWRDDLARGGLCRRGCRGRRLADGVHPTSSARIACNCPARSAVTVG
jgi:hypothetical protein